MDILKKKPLIFVPIRAILSLLILCQGVSGCGYEFPLKNNGGTDTMPASDSEDDTKSETETAVSTESESKSESESATQGGSSTDTPNATASEHETASSKETLEDTVTGQPLPPCPKGLAFLSEPTFTPWVQGKEIEWQYLDSCPENQLLVGFHGYLRSFTTYEVHGRLQGICGSLSLAPDGDQCIVQTSPADTLALRGAKGDIEWTRMCPTNQIVTGFSARTGINIDQMTFRCAPLSMTGINDHYELIKGASSALTPVGGNGGSNVGPIECSGKTMARVTNISAGDNIAAFGLGCQFLQPLD